MNIWCILFLVCEVLLCVNGKKYMDNRFRHKKPIKYKVKPQHIKQLEITINIKMHGDKELITYLKESGEIDKEGKNTARVLKNLKKDIILHTKSAEILMNNPTIGTKIKLNIMSINFMTKRAPLIQDENASNYLRNYCSLQALKKNETNVFYSILISGVNFRNVHNIDEDGHKRGRSTGRSYSGGVCKPTKSCAIIQLRSQNLDYLIAHELAHSLGIHHDTSAFNDCKTNNTLMGTSYVKGSHPRGWSACNRRDLKRFLMTKHAWCLRGQRN